MNLKFVLAASAVVLISLAVAQREAKNSYDLTKDFKATVPLSSKGGTIVLSASRAKKELEVTIGSETQRFALETIDDTGSPAQGNVLVEDFDFDGFNDVGVASGIGYNGVNTFYDVQRYDPTTKKLVKLEGKDFEVSNPTFDTKNQILLSDSRSGPFWYGKDFKFSSSQPWVYRLRTFRNLIWDSSEKFLEQSQVFNKAGQMVQSSVTDSDAKGNPIPVTRTAPEKLFLFSAPKASAKTTNFIVRGDKVQVLEIAGKLDEVNIEKQQWVKIAYQSKKLGRIERWLDLRAK